MPCCLMLAPFPVAFPRQGGQARAASLARALAQAGWQVHTVGIYHADCFPADERGLLDIVSDDPAVAYQARTDPLFGDLHIARGAAKDRGVICQLQMLLTRLRPDVVQIEHPWSWLVLRAALPAVDRPKIVYSSHNVETHLRLPLLRLNLNFNRPDSDQLMTATHLLETELAREADLTLSISDLERTLIAEAGGREVAYVPPVSDLAEHYQPHEAFSREARGTGCRYAALMGSAYTANCEGFFSIFPHGLGFLSRDEQIWVAGSLGHALREDPRYRDFQSVNESRLRDWGFVAEADKASFFAAASCVIVPVLIGAGAKTKMADALASHCPVITTSHAIEGYGPLVGDLLGNGVYVADTPRDFRDLIRRALREGLAPCPPEAGDRVSPARMVETLASLYAGLLRDHVLRPTG